MSCSRPTCSRAMRARVTPSMPRGSATSGCERAGVTIVAAQSRLGVAGHRSRRCGRLPRCSRPACASRSRLRPRPHRIWWCWSISARSTCGSRGMLRATGLSQADRVLRAAVGVARQRQARANGRRAVRPADRSSVTRRISIARSGLPIGSSAIRWSRRSPRARRARRRPPTAAWSRCCRAAAPARSTRHTPRLLDALARVRERASDGARRCWSRPTTTRTSTSNTCCRSARRLPVEIVRDARATLRAADAAAIASGTAVLEAALIETPACALYVLSAPQAKIARRIYQRRVHHAAESRARRAGRPRAAAGRRDAGGARRRAARALGRSRSGSGRATRACAPRSDRRDALQRNADWVLGDGGGAAEVRIYHTSDVHDHRHIAAPISALRAARPACTSIAATRCAARRPCTIAANRSSPSSTRPAVDVQAMGNREFHYLFGCGAGARRADAPPVHLRELDRHARPRRCRSPPT